MEKGEIVKIREHVSGESRFHFSYICGVDVSYVYKMEKGREKPNKSLQKLILIYDELNEESPSIDKMRQIMNTRMK